MSGKNKNYNSIIFLTTLSVYLGLVLVGSSPQVLAQERFSKAAQIKRDSKFACPNNELIEDEIGREINPFEYNFAERLIELIKTTDDRIQIVKEIEQQSVKLPFFFRQIEFAPYIKRNGKLEENDWKDESSDWTSAAHAGQISELHSLFLIPLSDCSKPTKQKIVLNSINLQIDNNWLNSEFIVKKVSQQRANQLAESLKQLFKLKTSSTNNQAVKDVYQHTEIRAGNNQVFIVTRLPRAGIDSLLN